MIGLALEGGGTKGAYQVGVYKALKNSGIKINGLAGTSIGSINAALIVAGLENELENFWLNEDISSLLGINMNENKTFMDNVLNTAKGIFKEEGLSIEKLKVKLNELINENKFRKSNRDFGLVTYRLKDKKPLYLFKEDIPKGKIVDYILASSFLPVFRPMLLDGDSYYLDGGFYDISPSNMLEEKSYKTIYVVTLKTIGMKRKRVGNSKIIKISPSRPLGSIFNTDKLKIYENIEMGYYDTLRIIQKLDGYKFVFAKKSKWLYNLYVRGVSKKTLNRAQVFFFTHDNKELIIKALEYVFTKEKYSYSKIYDPFKEISKLKKLNKDQIAYKFIKELNII